MCKDGKIFEQYIAKITCDPLKQFELSSDSNGRRIESSFKFCREYTQFYDKYFIFERDQRIFKRDTLDLNEANMLNENLELKMNDKLPYCESWVGRRWIEQNGGVPPTH